METRDERDVSILRPRMAKWLKVSENDVFRWLFWKEFKRNAPDDEEIAHLKDKIMDVDWPLIDMVISEGRGNLWFRLKCRLASNVDNLGLWIFYRNVDNNVSGIVDVEKDQKFARERLEVLKNRESKGGLMMYELEDAARCYETLGDQVTADKYYRKILDVKLKGTKWQDSPGSPA